jgi:hypothetical protein
LTEAEKEGKREQFSGPRVYMYVYVRVYVWHMPCLRSCGMLLRRMRLRRQKLEGGGRREDLKVREDQGRRTLRLGREDLKRREDQGGP